MALAVLADELGRLLVAEVPDALLADPVELDPGALPGGVDQAEGVAAEPVHVAVAQRDAPLAHRDGDLVERLGQQGPEVPVVLRAAQVGARVALHGVVQIRELERVAEEEDGRVVAHEVPVALVGVQLDGEPADVALRVRGAALAGHGAEAHEEVGLLARLEHLGARVLGDVVGDGEGAERAGPLGVHPALRDHLAVEVGELLQIPHVLHQHRAALAGRERVLVVGDRGPEVGGELVVCVSHGRHSPCSGRRYRLPATGPPPTRR